MIPPLSHENFLAYKNDPTSWYHKTQLEEYRELVSFMEKHNRRENVNGNLYKKFIMPRKQSHFAIDKYQFSECKVKMIIEHFMRKFENGDLF